MEIVGLIPAAGQATRLGKLPCSKEILPVYYRDKPDQISVLSSHLIKAYQLAGIKQVHFVLRKGKWDIPQYYGNGAEFNMHFSYLIMQYPYGVPFSLNEAYPFVKDKIVTIGFPDIIFHPVDGYKRIYDRLVSSKADVVLGLLRPKNKTKWDMVDLDENGNITDIVIKQKRQDLEYGWAIAIWKPSFTEYFHKQVEDAIQNGNEGKTRSQDGTYRELYPGDIILNAIHEGFNVQSVIFEDGKATDLGTLKELNGFIFP